MVFFIFLLPLRLAAQEALPQWALDLWNQNATLIDSILYYPADAMGPETRTYVIYYHQPLNHAQPNGEQFPLRALVSVFRNGDPTKAVNHVYATGYNLDLEYLYRPDSTFYQSNTECDAEIAHRYKANFIQIEHRYFQFSAPTQCWTRLDYLRAEEAAADFHALFEAFKKVLKGKYVMSGVSKGGITTLLQHRFYPNDMDIYVPYSAPFFDTDRDIEMQKYWYTTGWNKEWLDRFMSFRRNALARKESILTIYFKMVGDASTKPKQDSLYWHYLRAAADFGFWEHAYSDTASLRKITHTNDSIMRAKGVESYGDTVYAYMMDRIQYDLKNFPAWLDTLRKYPEPDKAPVRRGQSERFRLHHPFGITYDQWWGRDTIQAEAYEYQAKCELGYFDFRFDLIIEDASMAKLYNDYWVQNAGDLHSLINPFYRSLTFSPTLYNETMAATKNATKPIILIYGEDDAWTGAAVKDEFVNGTNVRKFILPGQNHQACFSSDTDKAKCNAIRAALDAVLSTPQGIENPTTDGEGRAKVTKVIENGRLVIIRNGERYDVTGKKY